jgi:hypothetical protein
MAKIYETIKNIGRKYLAPAVLALSIAASSALPGCGKKEDNSGVPISENARQELVEQRKQNEILLVEEYTQKINSAEKMFERVILDGEFTSNEQYEVYHQLNSTEKLMQDINQNYKLNLQMPEKDKKLKNLLYSNFTSLHLSNFTSLHLFREYGGSNLEKQLHAEGFDVKVQNPHCSALDLVMGLLITWTLGGLIIAGGHSLVKKLNKR